MAPEVLFHNGSVFDGRRFLAEGSGVLVRGGQVVAVGPLDELGRASAAEEVDLEGGTLLPGFVDAHAHPVFGGEELRRCDLRSGRSAADYLALIAAYAAAHPELEWVTGGGWAMEAFPRGIPTRQALDDVVGDRPAFFPNRDHHGAWVSTKALELAGIDRSTPDPADGRIERDEHGEPSGMLQEGAAALVSRLLPATTDEQYYEALLLAQQHFFSLGITGWQDAIVGNHPAEADPSKAYRRAAVRGELKARVVGALWWDRARGLEQLPELLELRRAQHEAEPVPRREGRYATPTVKMMLDGVAETHTAAMLEPYLDDDGCATASSGLDFVDPVALPGYVAALDAEGFQVHFHALGDRAVRLALDGIEAARRRTASRLRHHLAHVQVIHPDDLDRFARLGATANIQALWAVHDRQMDELTLPILGPRRSSWQYPFASLEQRGARLCGGSDWPVTSADPLWAAHAAVNRWLPKAAGGETTEPFLPEQALSLESFLAAYTSGSAWVNGLEDLVGTIAPSFDADLITLDADLAHLPPGEIGSARVTKTFVRGELVHTAPARA